MAAAARKTDTAEGRAKIMAAAIEEFSRYGVDGTTLRQIAARAGLQHQLIVYHFRTKDALWKAVVSDICDTAQEELYRLDAVDGDPAQLLRLLVHGFVAFTARHPQLHRMLTFEGRTDSERLRWWMHELSSGFYAASSKLIRAAQRAGTARTGHPGRLHYAMIGMITTSFVFEYEYRALTGLDPFGETEIEAVAEMACDFLGLPSRVRARSRVARLARAPQLSARTR